ncbi:glucose-1-phosphate cytidylyltransferase [Microvirga tunisiensis]|uniref:Glucose-1-phosphate cytidylyltransferase n=1 Tax=Microvirga tunisiensis TaxID=2108360 RepID=A0A5N7MSR8_9HYPH|nr:glucose-1-phosphate cytidylyltransferase [Microvirga tunisiensis]MPR12097.1 glucose-1-phosphate cytidylyltransferase [Microvirga tunisiensis]MPR30037.1 glucose-1-phosphate cytidylyltransferase [Microvirga tunisiensis]
MKAVILAGGLGTRISEETSVVPKPLVEIGEEPIIWHIMKIFAAHGIKDFIICCGYKGHLIKKYFFDYQVRHSNLSIGLAASAVDYLDYHGEDWNITLVDTGLSTMTGGRLKRISSYLDDEPFFMTYGDGVGDVDLTALRDFHASHGKAASVTAVQPTGRFGAMYIADDNPIVSAFNEKPQGDGAWINGGFFLLNPSVLNLIEDDNTVWERGPMVALAETGQLMAHRHFGFWHPMDTLRDKTVLNEMWAKGEARWKLW